MKKHIKFGINTIYENVNFRNQLVKLGEENASKFSWKKTAFETLDTYRKLI